MNILYLLIGIVLGAAVFGATFWSAAQAYLQRGRLRVVHLALVGLVLAGMATVSLILPGVAMIVGSALIFAGCYAVILERRWNRLLPLAQIGFGGALAAGVPFG